MASEKISTEENETEELVTETDEDEQKVEDNIPKPGFKR